MNRRRSASMLAAVLLTAIAFVAVAPSSSADDNAAPARNGDPDAGSDGVTAPASPSSGPAPETISSVADEAEYRAALIALSADGAGPHTIEITDSFTIDDGTDPTYDGDQNLTINGNGNTVTSGVGDQRFLEVDSEIALTINDLTVEDFTRGSSGGAINADGSITVNNSRFIGNRADGDGGAIDVDESATVSGSTFEDNHADDGDGGAIDTSDEDSPVIVDTSTFRGNTADDTGGAISNEGDTTATTSTFVGNDAEEGGAIGSYGSVTMANSTVTGNTSDYDIIDGSGDETGVGDVTLTHVTIEGNTVESDEGVIDSDEDGVLTMIATTVSNTLGGGSSCEENDFSSVVAEYSRSDDFSCDLGGGTNLEGAGTPALASLADNGGPTETMLPGDDLLIDVVPAADCTLPDDQRFLPRPEDGDADGEARCDVGAVEIDGPDVEPAPPEPVPPEPPAVEPVAAAPAFTG